MARGEPGVGKWSVVVKDTNVNENNGTFTDWKLTLWGECIDASIQGLLPMPEEDEGENQEIISAEVSTATISLGSGEMGLANPTGHISRPINAKPTYNVKSTTTKLSVLVSPTANTKTSPITTATTIPGSAENFLPHYFPAFGVSKRTQIWIYGALAIIILFCVGLGIYFYVQHRKRLLENQEEYEFDVLDGDDSRAVLNPGTKGRRAKKRAGELYDAFAGESDEELLSNDEGDYRDIEEEQDEERGRSESRTDEEERKGLAVGSASS